MKRRVRIPKFERVSCSAGALAGCHRSRRPLAK